MMCFYLPPCISDIAMRKCSVGMFCGLAHGSKEERHVEKTWTQAASQSHPDEPGLR